MKIFPEGFSIAATAPAGAVAPELISAGKAVLEKLGAQVKIMPHTAGRDAGLPYLSGSDDERAADLISAWLDPEIDIIWAVRGGYGCGKLLEKLNWQELAKHPKMVAGFSDITALHWAMTAKNCGTPMALPMFAFLNSMDETTFSTLAKIFRKEESSFSLPALRPGNVRGLPLPGNITVAASLCGTPFFPDTSGKILILEEIGEYPYRIDRNLNQLRLAGAFENCAAVVFSHFTSAGEPEEIMHVLKDFTRRVKCPVFHSFQYGHELPFVSLAGDVCVEFSAAAARAR